jgi:hypothetical protein
VAQRHHVLEDRAIRLRGTRALPARLETPAQHLPLPFRTAQPLTKQGTLTVALLELGAEPPIGWQATDQIAYKASPPAHLKAIIAPR